jgi:hypothetical protein
MKYDLKVCLDLELYKFNTVLSSKVRGTLDYKYRLRLK